MSRSHLLAALLGLVAAVVCVRLGFWQLERHEQRQALNASVAARRAAAPVPLEQLPADSGARFRLAVLRGRWDYEREFVLGGRTHGGSPGVYLITPLRRDDGRAVLVNRGWVYSADASTVELPRWREADTATVVGYAELLPTGGDGADPRGTRSPRTWRRLDSAWIARTLPYPVDGRYLVALPDSVAARAGAPGVAAGAGDGGPDGSASRPARLGFPSLDDGPHLGYAAQWFIFGLIAVVGPAVLILHERRRRPSG